MLQHFRAQNVIDCKLCGLWLGCLHPVFRVFLRGLLQDRLPEVSLGGTQTKMSETFCCEGEQEGWEIHGGHQGHQTRGNYPQREGRRGGSLTGAVQARLPGLLRLPGEDVAPLPGLSGSAVQQEV